MPEIAMPRLEHTTFAKRPSPAPMLVNKPRAYAVLEELKLDGLIALNPVNVYYLTNSVTIFTKFLRDYPSFATFSRDPKQPSFLVADAHEAWRNSNGDHEVPEIMTYTVPDHWQSYINATPEQMHIEPNGKRPNLPMLAGSTLTPREQRWLAANQKYNSAPAASSAHALVRALKASGLDKGRIAVDDMRIAYVLQQLGLTDISFVPGENVFRHIRMVKTEAEIALLRIASQNNADAVLNTIKAIGPGMLFSEVEDQFRLECARLGSNLTSFIAGTGPALFPEGETVVGRPFLIDAVSSFAGYQGDFARTVVIGEPRADVLQRARATAAGRDAGFDKLRPGVLLSEVRQAARDALIKSGMPEEIIIVNPHSVGLEHDDNPWRLDVHFPVSQDIALQENMVLTLDLPYNQVGWGSGHHEDMVRITKHGYEPLNVEGDPLVIA